MFKTDESFEPYLPSILEWNNHRRLKHDNIALESELDHIVSVESMCNMPIPEQIPIPQSPVTEGYVGKTQNIMKIENLFGQMIKKYGSNNIIDKSFMTLNDCKEKKEIEILIQKEFGFHSVNIVIRPRATVNAYTCSMSALMRYTTTEMPTAFTAHGQKWYDVGHSYDYFMCMYNEDFNGDLTAGELTAMTLHEIGHNFDVSTSFYVADVMLHAMCFASGAFLTPFFKHIIGKLYTQLCALLERITPAMILYNVYLTIMDIVSLVMGPFGSLTYIGQMAADIAQNPLMIPQALPGFGKEKFADSFAAAYGYSAETISLMDKLDRLNQTTDKGRFIDTWTWSGTVAPTILYMLIDPHPEYQTRARMVLDDMKELSESKDLPPNMRANAKKEYERAKKAYDLFLQVDKDKNNGAVLRLSRNFKETYLTGKLDFRSYLFSCSALQVSEVSRRRKK